MEEQSARERLERYSVRRESGCVEWTGAIEDGYGRMSMGRKEQRRVHCVAWEIEYGPIPAGRDIHHRCLNKLCVNPDHLECLTKAQHRQRHAEEWRRATVRCAYGHEYEPTYTASGSCRGCLVCVAERRAAKKEGRVLPRLCRNGHPWQPGTGGCATCRQDRKNRLQADRIAKAEAAGRPFLKQSDINALKTHCPRGHEYTPENTRQRPDYHGRECKTCIREYQRRRYQQRKTEG